MKSEYKERFMQAVFFIAACASILAVALICIFLFANGIPAMGKIGFLKFLTGDQWRPQYDYMAFKKSVPVNYGVAERKSLYSDNVHRQYYWTVQWAINNLPDDVKKDMAYLVKDLDNDSTPELILKNYKGEGDKILTMKQNYLADYEGEADYEGDTFSALDDNAQLDSIYDITKTDNVNYQ